MRDIDDKNSDNSKVFLRPFADGFRLVHLSTVELITWVQYAATGTAFNLDRFFYHIHSSGRLKKIYKNFKKTKKCVVDRLDRRTGIGKTKQSWNF